MNNRYGKLLVIFLLLVITQACSKAVTNDLVTIKSGPPILGHVELLENNRLVVKEISGDQRSLTRQELISIKFDATRKPPDSWKVSISNRDQVILLSGEVKYGDIKSISEGEVFSDAGRFERKHVYMILFAGNKSLLPSPPPIPPASSTSAAPAICWVGTIYYKGKFHHKADFRAADGTCTGKEEDGPQVYRSGHLSVSQEIVLREGSGLNDNINWMAVKDYSPIPLRMESMQYNAKYSHELQPVCEGSLYAPTSNLSWQGTVTPESASQASRTLLKTVGFTYSNNYNEPGKRNTYFLSAGILGPSILVFLEGEDRDTWFDSRSGPAGILGAKDIGGPDDGGGEARKFQNEGKRMKGRFYVKETGREFELEWDLENMACENVK